MSEAAEVIAGVTGKPVKHNDIDRDVRMGSRPNDNAQKATGAPPIKFADVARRTARAWTWTGPS